ncbi:MAG TPA: type II toxin-antitoxin system RelE/ParE family toxin [Beijerinckiaceae bacterium]
MKRIVWADTARRDYLGLLRRIRADNPAAAARVAGEITKAVEGLARHNTGRAGRVAGTYEKSVTGLPYVVAYLDDGAEPLTILRIIHTARNWPHGRWPD